MNKLNDDFIANSIIQSDYLKEKYKDILSEFLSNPIIVDFPTSDLDPYYTLKSSNNKITFKATKIAFIDIIDNVKYLKWSWCDPTLSKSSKVNLLKILKYFLEQEPKNLSDTLMKINNAFIQSIFIFDSIFFEVLMNALLGLMKHLFYVRIRRPNIGDDIYFIKEVNMN
jgi:hypothetical protein